MPRSASAAASAAGSTPATGRSAASSDNSPMAVKPLDLAGGQRLHRRHQRQRDGQVEMGAFLGKVGGRQIERDALGRKREADGVQAGAHPLLRLRHGLVGQADDVKAGRPEESWHSTSTGRASTP
jgi:hypothetical protein